MLGASWNAGYEIYGAELGETACLLAAIVVLGLIGATRRAASALPAGLVLVTFLDLMLLGRHKLTDVGPLRAPDRTKSRARQTRESAKNDTKR